MITISFPLADDQWQAIKRHASVLGIPMDELMRDILADAATRILQAEALERYDEPSPPYRPRLLGL